jgi:hypothetical protein
MSQHVTLHLTDPLGINLSVEVPAESLYDAMRYWGGRGFTSGEIPPGGLRLPLRNEEDFDWRLIGARKFTFRARNPQTGEDEEVVAVAHRGEIYKRRDLAATKIMKRIIKYSRGAKATDDPNTVEGGDDKAGAKYVTLVVFQNENAPKEERYALPSTPQPVGA